MSEIEKGLRARMTARTVARSFKGAREPLEVKIKPVESTGPLTGPGSKRGEMDPSTYHRVGKSAFLEEPVAKADHEPSSGKPSNGRVFATYLGAPVHGLVAGRKGHKLGAAGSELGHGVAGGLVGQGVGMAATALSRGRISPAVAGAARSGGVAGGVVAAAHSNNRKGRYKAQKKKDDVAKSAFGVDEPIAKAAKKCPHCGQSMPEKC